MKFSLAIGVDEDPRKPNKAGYREALEKRLDSLGIQNVRHATNANMVEARWHYESLLTDHTYVAERTNILLGITKDSATIQYFGLKAECILGVDLHDFRARYSFHHDVISILPFRDETLMTFHRNIHKKTRPLAECVAIFQRFAEWFTVQMMIAMSLQQGYNALVKHHRFADAEGKFEQSHALLLQTFKFPPEVVQENVRK